MPAAAADQRAEQQALIAELVHVRNTEIPESASG